eukprot:scaffold6072_cov87-Isochrysis_galbana.AAC.2
MSTVLPSECTSASPSCCAPRTVTSGGSPSGPIEKPTTVPSAAATANEYRHSEGSETTMGTLKTVPGPSESAVAAHRCASTAGSSDDGSASNPPAAAVAAAAAAVAAAVAAVAAATAGAASGSSKASDRIAGAEGPCVMATSPSMIEQYDSIACSDERGRTSFHASHFARATAL